MRTWGVTLVWRGVVCAGTGVNWTETTTVDPHDSSTMTMWYTWSNEDGTQGKCSQQFAKTPQWRGSRGLAHTHTHTHHPPLRRAGVRSYTFVRILPGTLETPSHSRESAPWISTCRPKVGSAWLHCCYRLVQLRPTMMAKTCNFWWKTRGCFQKQKWVLWACLVDPKKKKNNFRMFILILIMHGIGAADTVHFGVEKMGGIVF